MFFSFFLRHNAIFLRAVVETIPGLVKGMLIHSVRSCRPFKAEIYLREMTHILCSACLPENTNSDGASLFLFRCCCCFRAVISDITCQAIGMVIVEHLSSIFCDCADYNYFLSNAIYRLCSIQMSGKVRECVQKHHHVLS